MKITPESIQTPRRCILLDRDEDGWPSFLYQSPTGKKFTVIVTIEKKDDGKDWLHVSVAGRSYMPPYEVVKEIKELFIGKDRYAVAIMPPEKAFVNYHEYCWHWWSCLEGHPLPEMSGPVLELGLEKSI